MPPVARPIRRAAGGHVDADLDHEVRGYAVVVAAGAVVPGRRQLGRPGMVGVGRCDRGRDLFGGRRVQVGAAAGDAQLSVAAVDAAQDQGLGSFDRSGDASDDCLGGRVAFDLGPGSGAGSVRFAGSFGDDALDADSGQLVEPETGDLAVVGLHSNDQPVSASVAQQVLQLRAPLDERRGGEVLVTDAEQVEQDQVTGLPAGQVPRSPAGTAVAALQGFKVQPAVGRPAHDFSVSDRAGRQLLASGGCYVGKGVVEVGPSTGQQPNCADGVDDHQASKAVPFRLIQPTAAGGQVIDQAGKHRPQSVGWGHGGRLVVSQRIAASPGNLAGRLGADAPGAGRGLVTTAPNETGVTRTGPGRRLSRR